MRKKYLDLLQEVLSDVTSLAFHHALPDRSYANVAIPQLQKLKEFLETADRSAETEETFKGYLEKMEELTKKLLISQARGTDEVYCKLSEGISYCKVIAVTELHIYAI